LRENATLKRLLADTELEKAVHHLVRVLGVSERFACRVTGQNRGTQRHPRAHRDPRSAVLDDRGAVAHRRF
jgi:hypothetical protein